MINYILGILIAAALIFAVIKQIKRKKTGGGCAGCTACRQSDIFQNEKCSGCSYSKGILLKRKGV